MLCAVLALGCGGTEVISDPPPYSLIGVVKNEAGSPIEGAEVQFRNLSDSTSSSGKFIFVLGWILVEGEVITRKSGYVTATKMFPQQAVPDSIYDNTYRMEIVLLPDPGS
jgi:hypothetical protein